MIPVLEQARRRMLIVVVVLVVIGAAAIGFLLSPWGASRTDRQIQRRELLDKVKADETEVLPLRDIDQKISSAGHQISAFEDTRLPAEYSQISDALNKLAADNHVQVSGVSYKPDKDVADGLRRVEMNAAVAAPYPELVRFINAMERSKTFFIVKDLSLQEQQAGSVKLQITFETYLRGAS